MKKERLFYLDFVRALAAVSIVITHYNAIFLYANPSITNCYVLDAHVFNIYIGSFGVSLFLIISGAALAYVYDGKINLKIFYWKRWKTLYPMFWIAYLVAFCYVYVYKGAWSTTQVPKWHILYSLIGMDGYLAEVTSTFYMLGEWFLGFIVIFYLLFPALKWLMDRHPIALAIVVMAFYVYLQVDYKIPFTSSKNLLVRLPELLFGMYFIKYSKKVNLPVAVASLVVLIGNAVIKPGFSEDIQTTYIGIAAFLFLVYISRFVQNSNMIEKVCTWLSKYSYAIFLVHHIVIWYVMMTFDLYAITHLESYLIFFGLGVVIAILSKILFETDQWLEKQVAKIFYNWKQSAKLEENNE